MVLILTKNERESFKKYKKRVDADVRVNHSNVRKLIEDYDFLIEHAEDEYQRRRLRYLRRAKVRKFREGYPRAYWRQMFEGSYYKD